MDLLLSVQALIIAVIIGALLAHSLNIEPTYEFLNANREELVRPISWNDLMIMFE
jgi:hypothetical protein